MPPRVARQRDSELRNGSAAASASSDGSSLSGLGSFLSSLNPLCFRAGLFHDFDSTIFVNFSVLPVKYQ